MDRPQEPALANKQKTVSADGKVAAPCIDREPGNKTGTATPSSGITHRVVQCVYCGFMRSMSTCEFGKTEGFTKQGHTDPYERKDIHSQRRWAFPQEQFPSGEAGRRSYRDGKGKWIWNSGELEKMQTSGKNNECEQENFSLSEGAFLGPESKHTVSVEGKAVSLKSNPLYGSNVVTEAKITPESPNLTFEDDFKDNKIHLFGEKD
ncbi:hypothetical protein MJT46_018768 [Ovis ammon polii x Ovis aries]|nr:hypothetical protein MJT46_018768 [Ovis ammon polii x Ovis aries]